MGPVIYLIAFSNGNTYVGATCNFTQRKKSHKASARRRKATSLALKTAFALYPNPEFTVVASGFDKKTLHLLEAQVISSLQPTLNTNTKPTPLPNPGLSPITTCPPRYGVKSEVFYMRRYLGWTTYEALGLHPRTKQEKPKVRKRLITASGETLSIDSWAARLKIKPGVIHARLSAGWTEEQAVGAAPRPPRKNAVPKREVKKRDAKLYTWKGKTDTLKNLCRHFDVPYARTYGRIKAGHPMEICFANDEQLGTDLNGKLELLPTP